MDGIKHNMGQFLLRNVSSYPHLRQFLNLPRAMNVSVQVTVHAGEKTTRDIQHVVTVVAQYTVFRKKHTTHIFFHISMNYLWI